MKENMKKLQLRKKKVETPSRITNETVAEHRERILAGGRRFKYPVQYAKHRLVTITIIISIVALLAFLLLLWQQLYIAQNTGSFFYRLTRVVPLPVAQVDGEYARYSDYLMEYRSSVHYLQQIEQINLDSADGKNQANYYKSQALDNVIASTYAEKIARSKNITVSDQQVTDAINSKRQAVNGELSAEAYDAVTLDFFGWSSDEHKRVMQRRLLQQQVAYSIDAAATDKKNKASELIKAGTAFDQIPAQLGGEGADKVEQGVSGLVPKTNNDGGRAAAAGKLQKGQVSDAFQSANGDGYYFVQLIESNDTQVNYAFIKIPLTEFKKQLDTVKAENKVQKYISIDAVTALRATNS